MRVMFATASPHPLNDGKVSPGALIAVDVPANCTIHSADAGGMAQVIALAGELVDAWSVEAATRVVDVRERLILAVANLRRSGGWPLDDNRSPVAVIVENSP